MGLESEWTMAAAAREYRETLAQEQRMAGDQAEAQRWELEQARRFEGRMRAVVDAGGAEDDIEAAE